MCIHTAHTHISMCMYTHTYTQTRIYNCTSKIYSSFLPSDIRVPLRESIIIGVFRKARFQQPQFLKS